MINLLQNNKCFIFSYLKGRIYLLSLLFSLKSYRIPVTQPKMNNHVISGDLKMLYSLMGLPETNNLHDWSTKQLKNYSNTSDYLIVDVLHEILQTFDLLEIKHLAGFTDCYQINSKDYMGLTIQPILHRNNLLLLMNMNMNNLSKKQSGCFFLREFLSNEIVQFSKKFKFQKLWKSKNLDKIQFIFQVIY